jgi:hypothetical protein
VDTGSREENASRQIRPSLDNVSELSRLESR